MFIVMDYERVFSKQITEIKGLVGRDKVLLGLSGGVDSSVVAKLLDMAVEQQLIASLSILAYSKK